MSPGSGSVDWAPPTAPVNEQLGDMGRRLGRFYGRGEVCSREDFGPFVRTSPSPDQVLVLLRCVLGDRLGAVTGLDALASGAMFLCRVPPLASNA